MHYRRAALALVLALCAFAPGHAAGQQPVRPRGRRAGALGPNVPNPFNAATSIPFTVGDSACARGSERHVVSLRVYNVLTQLVAIPTMQGAVADSGDVVIPVPVGKPMTNLVLPCGRYAAWWTGRVLHGGREAAPGVYVVQLIVDGEALPVRKMMRKR